jgi:hypothetical protein
LVRFRQAEAEFKTRRKHHLRRKTQVCRAGAADLFIGLIAFEQSDSVKPALVS